MKKILSCSIVVSFLMMILSQVKAMQVDDDFYVDATTARELSRSYQHNPFSIGQSPRPEEVVGTPRRAGLTGSGGVGSPRTELRYSRGDSPDGMVVTPRRSSPRPPEGQSPPSKVQNSNFTAYSPRDARLRGFKLKAPPQMGMGDRDTLLEALDAAKDDLTGSDTDTSPLVTTRSQRRSSRMEEAPPKQDGVKSMASVNIRVSLPDHTSQNYDYRARRYYDSPDPLVGFPARQPLTLKNELNKEHWAWLSREKARLQEYHDKRVKKKKTEKTYIKLSQDAKAEFGKLDVPVDILVKIEELKAQATQDHQAKVKTYSEIRTRLMGPFREAGISLDDAVLARELVDGKDESRELRRLLHILYKTVDELDFEKAYGQAVVEFHQVLQDVVEQLPTIPSYNDFAVQKGNVKAALLGFQEGQLSQKNEAIYLHLLAFQEHLLSRDEPIPLRDSPIEEPNELKEFKSKIEPLTRQRLGVTEAKKAWDTKRAEVREGAAENEAPLPAEDFIARKREQAEAILLPTGVSLDNILTVYDFFRLNDGRTMQFKNIIEKVHGAKKAAAKGASLLNSNEWYKAKLQEAFAATTDVSVKTALENSDDLIGKACQLLSQKKSPLYARINAVREAKKQFDRAASEFQDIEFKCIMQHVFRGQVANIDPTQANEFQVMYRITLEDPKALPMIMREAEFKECFLYDSEDGIHKVFKRTPKKLKAYLYHFRNQLDEKMDRPYQHRPEQFDGSNRTIAFVVTDPQEIRIGIQMLQTWLNAHLERESEIFEKIITVHSADYLPSVSGWFKWEAWKNSVYGDPFRFYQLTKFINKYPSLVVGKKRKVTSKEEEIRQLSDVPIEDKKFFKPEQFDEPLYDPRGERIPDPLREKIDQKKRSAKEEEIREQFKACGRRLDIVTLEEPQERDPTKLAEADQQTDEQYKTLQSLLGDGSKPFRLLYSGFDEGQAVTPPPVAETVTQRRVGSQTIEMRTSFNFPVQPTYIQLTRRLHQPAKGKKGAEFVVPKKVQMAEKFRDFSTLRPHRAPWFKVMSELLRKPPRLKGSFKGKEVLEELEASYQERLKEWRDSKKQDTEAPKRFERPKDEGEQRELYRTLWEVYGKRVALQTDQLRMIESAPKGLLSNLSLVKSPFEFFFVKDTGPEPTPVDLTTLDLSDLKRSDHQSELALGELQSDLTMKDLQLLLRQHVPTEVPGVFRYWYVLSSLKSLNLSKNALEKPPGFVFSLGLGDSLVELDISDNDLQTLNWMKGLRQLLRVNISNNPKIMALQAFGMYGIDAPRQLEQLNMANIGLTRREDFDQLRGFESLQLLDISGHAFEDEGTEAEPFFSAFSLLNLRVLIASDCQLRRSWVKNFPRMLFLEELNVVGNDGLEIVPPNTGKEDEALRTNADKFRLYFSKLQALKITEEQELKAEEGQTISLDPLG
jgi:hypothetical protein